MFLLNLKEFDKQIKDILVFSGIGNHKTFVVYDCKIMD